MSEGAVSESAATEVGPTPACDCPPPAERVAQTPRDPRAELLQMAGKLAQGRNPRLLATYLRLRRVVR